MPRVKLIDRPIEKKISIPTSIVAKVELDLFSALEGRVPHGKWSELVCQLLREHVAKQERRGTP